MLGTQTIDQGKKIDWGKTSEDYAKFRPGPPRSFYKKLDALGVGTSGQKILDLGTGTGVLARSFSKKGCEVIGTDISYEQIEMARALATKENLKVEFLNRSSEELDFAKSSFDVITANQCFLYFDKEVVVPLIKKILKPGGVFVTSHFSWMPFLDPIAKASEELILKHNPAWTAHSYTGEVPPMHSGLEKDFNLKGFFYYDEGIEFSIETWMGRIRACRGVGAAMSEDEVHKFDKEHLELLSKLVGKERFKVVHRLDAHIMVRVL